MVRRLLIALAYALASVIVVGGTLVLVAYGQGYTYDFSHHRFVHRGLVLLASTPTGAYITRDGVYTKHKTNRRDSYNPGTYLFKVDKPGYTAWSQTLTVEPGQVVSARYIILVPQPLVKTTVASTATAWGTSAISDDHQHLAVATAPTATEGAAVWIQDLPNGKLTKRYSLPAATATTPAETIVGLQWSHDDSHLLVLSRDSSGLVYRVIDADGSDAINLTSQYQLDFNGLQSLQFAPTDWHDLFWISSDGTLRRLDLNAQTVSGVLANNVSQFSFAGERLLYVTSTNLGQSLMDLVVHNPSQTTRLVQALPKSSSYRIAYASYQGSDELVVIPAATREATVYTGIFGSSPVSTIVARNVDNVVFSPSGRFAALYSSNNLVTYDFLLSSPTDIVNYPSPPLGATLSSLSWFDDYHLVMHLGGQTVFSDFDGTNRVKLGQTLDAAIPFGSNDQRSVYTYQSGNKGVGQRLVNVVIRR